MINIAYITAKAPYGILGETYILPELLAMKKLTADLVIMPRDKSDEFFHMQAKPLLKNTVSFPLFSIQIAKGLMKYIVKNPIEFLTILKEITLKAKKLKIALKNFVILPKAICISEVLMKSKISHIHAHYGSTTSTMALIISGITGIPWSFTVHRWDIPEDNILKSKCESASFIRAIDDQGCRELVKIINDMSLNEKISVIHVGVDVISVNGDSKKGSGRFTFICPAMFVSKKGHKYLFEACKILSEKGIIFSCLLAGDGVLKKELKKIIRDYNLNDYVKFLGPLSQERMFSIYKSGAIDAVVLPSIVTENGKKEGIPVSLMEAMAFKIPVISTNTGGIRELIGDGSGIMIEEKDPVAIANSIEKLMNDNDYYQLISDRGREKVEKDFNVNIISKHLLNLFSQKSFN